MFEPKFQRRRSRGLTTLRPPNNSLRGSIVVLLLLWCSAIAVAADPIPLRAGAMSMVFEPDNALLRYLKVGSDEVLRGISAPVRNQYWGTVPPLVKIVSLDQQPDHFTLKFDVACREREAM